MGITCAQAELERLLRRRAAMKPELVFELGFEGIQASPRHKSGVAVRFPRMLRWRTDKTAQDADSLDRVKALLNVSVGADVREDAV